MRTLQNSMRTLALPAALLAVVAGFTGCGTSYPVVRQQGSISTVTYPVAFGNYTRVYNTTYHIVNRYAVIKRASYKQGVIEAELSQDTQLFEKTRRTILARLYDEGDFWDVECRVLIEVEDSDVETLGTKQPRYKWRTVSHDQFLETRLNQEIKSALTGGAWKSKAPLKYRGVADRMPKKKSTGIRFMVPKRRAPTAPKSENSSDDSGPIQPPARKVSTPTPAPGDASEPVSDKPSRPISTSGGPKTGLNAKEYQRLGVHFFENGEYAKAENAFLSALELDATSSTAPFLLAQSRFALGRYTMAVKALRAGFGQHAAWEQARIDLRNFYRDPAIFAGQMLALEQHLTAHSDDLDARLLLGWERFNSADATGARDELGVVTVADPKDEVARALLKKANIRVALSSGSVREF